jgi:membrane protease YdiL (CAAX protease family)
MIHLESSFSGKNQFWRYVVMLAAILLVANTIGAIPLYVFYFKTYFSNPELASQFLANPSDLTPLGVDPITGLALMLIPSLAGFFAFAFLIRPLNDRSFIQAINGTSAFRWNKFIVSGTVWLLISAVYLFVYIKLDPENFAINNTSLSLIPLFLVSLLLFPFQAGLEELLFRGYLMQAFYKMVPRKWFPLIVTSLFFGLLHSFNPEVKAIGFMNMMPQYVLSGLIFGVITIMDDGIEGAMGAHTANNFFLSVMLTHKSSALQAPSVYEQITISPWVDFASLVLIAVLFLFILARLFRWNLKSLV